MNWRTLIAVNAAAVVGNLAFAVAGYPFNALTAFGSGLALALCVRQLTAHARDPLTEETR